MTVVQETRKEVAQLGGRVYGLEFKVDHMAGDIGGLKTGQAVIAARLDEQRAALSALIPTRLAAVPSAA